MKTNPILAFIMVLVTIAPATGKQDPLAELDGKIQRNLASDKWNEAGKTVLFTTGDVVHSPLPQLADKPYCTLEMIVLIRTVGRYFFGSPSAPPDRWMPLHQSANP